jgi:hypothetical protein
LIRRYRSIEPFRSGPDGSLCYVTFVMGRLLTASQHTGEHQPLTESACQALVASNWASMLSSPVVLRWQSAKPVGRRQITAGVGPVMSRSFLYLFQDDCSASLYVNLAADRSIWPLLLHSQTFPVIVNLGFKKFVSRGLILERSGSVSNYDLKPSVDYTMLR